MNSGRVVRLMRISRTVSELDQAIAFYVGALDFRVIDEATHAETGWGELMGIVGARGQSATLRLGQQEIELVAFDPPGEQYPAQSSSADVWFQHVAIVVSDMAAAYARLGGYAFGPISEGGPQRLPPTSGSVSAYKFRDPDGHPLELLQFPPGSGDDIWQEGKTVFLGIDHSAIAVADVERSIDFYTRVLGLRLAARSDCTFESLVDVVALQPARSGPPHVELLGYRKPKGRSIPSHTQANDIAADRLVFQVGDLAPWLAALRDERVEFISPGIVTLCGNRQFVLLRDPAGHLVLLCS